MELVLEEMFSGIQQMIRQQRTREGFWEFNVPVKKEKVSLEIKKKT